MTLGRLTKLDLRNHWPHEALNFTRWLAEPFNLGLLGDEIGLDIELVQTEANVGRFNVDILAKEENTDRKIIIENQLELTDHQHLGQLITYAAGLDAEYLVWIVREAREEHKQAIEWLNDITDEHLYFFLVQIELWQIDGSVAAPKFNIICRPNDWVKSVRSSIQSGVLTDTKTQQLEYWQELRDYAAKYYPSLKLRTPRPQHWYDISIGRSDAHIALTYNSRESTLGCELYIPASKGLFENLLIKKSTIEEKLNLLLPLSWQLLPERKASRIRVVLPFNVETNKETGFKWLLETTTKFKAVFGTPNYIF